MFEKSFKDIDFSTLVNDDQLTPAENLDILIEFMGTTVFDTDFTSAEGGYLSGRAILEGDFSAIERLLNLIYESLFHSNIDLHFKEKLTRADVTSSK